MQSFWPLLLLMLLQLAHQIHSQTAEQATATTTAPTATTGGATTAATGRPPPPRVLLKKCCHQGDFLNSTTLTCMTGVTEMWVPFVFLVQQQRFFQPSGEKPRFMKFLPNVRPNCPEQQMELFSSLQLNVVLFPNGTMSLRERGIHVEPDKYCVDHQVVLVCLQSEELPPANKERMPGDEGQQQQRQPGSEAAATTLRMRKCCGKWGSYNSSTKSCVLQTPADSDGQLQLAPKLLPGSYQTSYGLPACLATSNGSESSPGGYAIAGDWHEATLNRSSGGLQLTHTNLSRSQYCLEHTERAGEVKIIVCSQHFAQDANSIHTGGYEEGGLQKAVLDVGILISIVFLAATLVAGYMLPAVHHALHWRCQIYYVFCLLLGKILLAIEELNTSLVPGSVSCLLLATGMQFFFLSAFFWLNTMCVNIWWTFRDFRPSSLERNQELLRLRLYSAYAWGVPLLICAIAACMDQLPESETSLLRPGFGQTFCWFDNRSLAIFAYFYGPIGLLLCANIMLFISTTHQLTCGLWKRDDVKSTSEKSALGRVCLKLVVVMGVTWIWDIISWLVGGPHDAWLLTDLINALQGVFIFIVVGCQPQVWTACKRICCPRLRHDITNTTNGVQHSSSSQGLPSMAGCGTEFTQNTSMNVTSSTSPPSTAAGVGVGVGAGAGATAAAGAPGDAEKGVVTSSTVPKIPMETIC